jgi:hypothetical protein
MPDTLPTDRVSGLAGRIHSEYLRWCCMGPDILAGRSALAVPNHASSTQEVNAMEAICA